MKTVLVTGAGGFIGTKEAREVFNRGQIILDTDKTPTDIPKPQQPESPSWDTDDDDEDEEEGLYKYQLDVSQKAMIEKRKLQAAKEKALGEELSDEQDGNSKDKD